MQKIGIWGQFGSKKEVADGQAIRTITISTILENKFSNSNVVKLSTLNWKKRPISFFFKTINLIRKSENLLILPADNGFKIIVPLINFFNRFYNRNILYIIIGGFLPNLLKKHHKYIKMVNKFSYLFSQTVGQINELKELGIKNIKLLPNIRLFNSLLEDEVLKNDNQVINLVYFSRITEDKGVEDAIEGVKLANKAFCEIVITLDFYGIVPKNYEDRFHYLLEENKNFISYKGVGKFDETVDILKDYFALLFPTYYYGEGQAGVFLDSYFSAIPIIATDWKYNKEFVKNNFNGILVPIKDPKSISDAIIKLYRDRDLHYKMRKNALLISYDYDADKLIQPLIDVLK